LGCTDPRQGVGLRGGLALSLLLHAGFLYLAPEVRPKPLPGKPSAFSATLVREPTRDSLPATRAPTEPGQADVLRMASELTVPAPGDAAPLSQDKPEIIVDAAYTKDTGTAEKTLRRVVQFPPGTAGVVLVIDPEGAVGEIVWGSLPVLTVEQIEAIERSLRQRRFPALGRVYPANEIVNLMTGELINLPAVGVDASSIAARFPLP
jgi:hypothetical protein